MKNLKNAILAMCLLMSCIAFAQSSGEGEASYYSDKYHLTSATASGEMYDKTKFTAAHKTLPFGTWVKVSRIDNGQSVTVKINDRGPFVPGRVLDLSRVAAEQIGMIQAGHLPIKFVIVDGPSAGGSTTSIPPPSGKLKPTKTNTNVKPSSSTNTTTSTPPPPPPAPEKTAPTTPSVSSTSTANKTTRYGVQVASFATYDNALNHVQELQARSFSGTMISTETGSTGQLLYRVILGPFDSRAKADVYKSNLKKNYKMDGFTMDLTNYL